MKIISRSVFAGLFLIAGLSAVVPTDVYAKPNNRTVEQRESEPKKAGAPKKRKAKKRPHVSSVGTVVAPSPGSVLRGTTCPGPDDALPAYSLEDIRAAIFSDANARIKLCQSIDGAGAQVFPVTYDPTTRRSSLFSGAFFGNNFEIANLELIRPLSQTGWFGENLGLFQFILGPGNERDGVRAQVRDLALRNIRAPRNLMPLTGEGILAGRIYDAEIRNISITASSVGGANTAVGLMAGFLGFSEVTDIRLNGVVGDVEQVGGQTHGGLAGWAFVSSIERVVLNGVQVNNGPLGSWQQSGYTGGVVGRARQVTFRDIQGSVSASSATSILGGVLGYNLEDEPLSFERINLTVNLRGNNPTSGDPTKPGIAGGVIGYSRGPVHIVDTRISGPIEASEAIGGLVGVLNHYNPQFVTSSIERSAYIGDELSADSRIGGLVGSVSDSGMMIRNCFAQANLRASSSPRHGFGGIGGLVGNVGNFFQDVGMAPLELTNSYFSGSVSIPPASTTQYGVGGMVGYREGPVAVSQALFDGELLPEAMRTNSFGIPAASQAMRNDPDLYAGWNFASTWRFIPGQLPTLRAFDRQAADVNRDGAVTPDDIFAFLEFFFSHNLAGDVNRDGAMTLQDLFSFLVLYFLANS